MLLLQPAVIRATSNYHRERIKQGVLLSLLRKQCPKSPNQEKKRKESNRIIKKEEKIVFFVSFRGIQMF